MCTILVMSTLMLVETTCVLLVTCQMSRSIQLLLHETTTKEEGAREV